MRIKELSLAALVALSGCAFDVTRVKMAPATLVDEDSCDHQVELTETAEIELDTGYKRALKKRTRWRCVGRIPEGDVFRTSDQILTVEASNMYEAYIVTNGEELHGFYLPVEQAFTPLKQSIPLAIRALGDL